MRFYVSMVILLSVKMHIRSSVQKHISAETKLHINLFLFVRCEIWTSWIRCGFLLLSVLACLYVRKLFCLYINFCANRQAEIMRGDWLPGRQKGAILPARDYQLLFHSALKVNSTNNARLSTNLLLF